MQLTAKNTELKEEVQFLTKVLRDQSKAIGKSKDNPEKVEA